MNGRSRPDVRRLTTLAVTVSVAMILSYIESLIPVFIPIPGVKLGLSNIATVFALYTLGAPAAVTVSVVRVLLSALLFGNAMSLIFSLSGALLSLAFMVILKNLGIFSSVGVSSGGAVAHNAGQIIAAVAVMENAGITAYLAPLILTGTLAGVVIGVASGILVARVSPHIG